MIGYLSGTLRQLDATRALLGAGLAAKDGVDPDDVIMSPESAARRGLTSTFCAPIGNIAPEGSVMFPVKEP